MIITILCGGVGSRLWPVSRSSYPKQFIKLPDGRSFIQKTFLRGIAIEGVTEVVVVTNSALYFMIRAELQEVNDSNIKITYILEPVGRSTAPAVAAAALYSHAVYGNRSMIVLSADHLIKREQEFMDAVDRAELFAKRGNIVVFGITPDRPDTGYGYIEAVGNEVLRFVEKPSLEDAMRYLAAGNYCWNSGIFYFKTETILNEYQKCAPDLLQDVKGCMSKVAGDFIELDVEKFAEVENISLDYAIMEKSDNLAIISCDIGWTDIGSWNAYSSMYLENEAGNKIIGDVIAKDSSNCFIRSEDRLIATIGVKDLLIIDTHDALLIADKAKEQEIKTVFNQLKTEGHAAHRDHQTTFKPWGSYTLLQSSDNFKIKHIRVKPQEALSLQSHQHRSEHWIVVQGVANVFNGDAESLVRPNESIYIKAGDKHRVRNDGDTDLIFIEVQCGEILDENDIERYDDKYGRK
ncbi:MAG: mannose-1-phosphate guanylyltransferase/mannose-6-phosphate isomerase [Deferribacteraceae bacterium]|jgi:mannose-1-phosphate guanylyltransferase|nr:mannose-1-phosphate guanylyltransferase/mannose-6-phosphate isomerase [Deferribacteraceae bacterium]